MKNYLADILTPVSLYLKIRDKFPKSVLLESSDYHGIENSYSYICLDPIAQFKVEDGQIFKQFPNQETTQQTIEDRNNVVEQLSQFISSFDAEKVNNQINGFFGYTAYNSIQYFEKLQVNTEAPKEEKIPDLLYSFYRYIISVNHYKNELVILEIKQVLLKAGLMKSNS